MSNLSESFDKAFLRLLEDMEEVSKEKATVNKFIASTSGRNASTEYSESIRDVIQAMNAAARELEWILSVR